MKFFFALLLSACVFSSLPTVLLAQEGIFTTARVVRVLQEEEFDTDAGKRYIQIVEVIREDTKELLSLRAGSRFQPLEAPSRLDPEQTIIITTQIEDGVEQAVLVDSTYRLPILAIVAVAFFMLVVVVARLQGLLSIAGMTLSIGVLTLFIIPGILTGSSPFFITILGCIIIAALSMYVSHGLSKKSHIAFASILITLVTVALLSSFILNLARMTGLGSEEASFLQLEPGSKVNLQGLLLAGIILGTLGVLDDICISQVSIVNELKKANPNIKRKQLFLQALTVGKDHIASLVNTLVLAYAGSSLPLFLLFSLNNIRPLWVVLNDEMIAEEIVRTLVGSIGLVLAIPLTTFVAVFFLQKALPASKHSH